MFAREIPRKQCLYETVLVSTPNYIHEGSRGTQKSYLIYSSCLQYCKPFVRVMRTGQSLQAITSDSRSPGLLRFCWLVEPQSSCGCHLNQPVVIDEVS